VRLFYCLLLWYLSVFFFAQTYNCLPGCIAWSCTACFYVGHGVFRLSGDTVGYVAGGCPTLVGEGGGWPIRGLKCLCCSGIDDRTGGNGNYSFDNALYKLTSVWRVSLAGYAWWQPHCSRERSWASSSPVSTGIGDRLWQLYHSDIFQTHSTCPSLLG